MNNIETWAKSPITGKDMVLQEFDLENGFSKMDLSSGYYTNEYPLNYTKHKDFDIEKYEQGMPDIIKDNRYDDGESYWYPSIIQTAEAFVFPTEVIHSADDDLKSTKMLKWCWAPVKQLSAQEISIYSTDVNYESKVDMENAEYFVNYLDACKKIKGYSLGDL
jgi:hypothetical protein